MIKVSINILSLLLLLCLSNSCSKKVDLKPADTGSNNTTTHNASNNPNGYPTIVTVDCSQTQGNVMRIEQANVNSTTGALPGEKSRVWLQSLNHTTIRTWLALRTIYSKGYNYDYDGNIAAETSLAFLSTCTDSLLIALTAYTPSASYPLPDKGLPFQNFIKETVKYYKTKYPKIKYIQAGNEPDYNGELAADYYEVYKDYYKAINAANVELGLTGNNRILLSNGAFTSTTSFSGVITYTNQFLALYAADPDITKKLDFFSFNCYTDQSNPKIFETAKPQIISAMSTRGLPSIPVFVTEYGLVGGDFIPSAWTQADIMTAWAPAQLAKAFYLYEGGIDKVFNWCITHGTILNKSELADLTNAYANPYGNALVFCKELSSRITRIKATSTKLSDKGLGINAIASMGNSKGIAVLVWNFNYTNPVADQNINVQINNIPQTTFATGKLNTKVYIIDSKNNNIFNNSSQTSLKTIINDSYTLSGSLSIPLKLEQNAVALIVITP